tara:strand:+ start:1814 stop:1975 length:162 start_codon:yes stop_codon:yes gene_type:complete
MTKGNWFELLKVTGAVMTAAGGGKTGLDIGKPTKGYSIGGKKRGKEDDEERGC